MALDLPPLFHGSSDVQVFAAGGWKQHASSASSRATRSALLCEAMRSSPGDTRSEVRRIPLKSLLLTSGAAIRMVQHPQRRHGRAAKAVRHAEQSTAVARSTDQPDDRLRIGWQDGEEDRISQLYTATKERPSDEEQEPQVGESADPDGDAKVFSIAEDIAVVISGGPIHTSIRPGTLIYFSGGGTGVLLAWKELVCAVYIQPESKVPAPGEIARCTDAGPFLMTECSTGLVGRIVSSLGAPMDGGNADQRDASEQLTFAEYKGMTERNSDYRPLFTGVIGIDFGVPVGRGQTMLMQGSHASKDKEELWLDIMCVEAPLGKRRTIGITVCDTLTSARRLQQDLKERGAWNRSIIVVADSEMPGAGAVAINGALAIAEQVQRGGDDAIVQVSLEPLSRVWMLLAREAATEREARGIYVDPTDERWVDMEGTMVRESISERRRFWFSTISRALNSLETNGSISIIAWLWEQEGGTAFRKQQAYQMKAERIQSTSIEQALKDKMMAKLCSEALEEGIPFGDDAELLQEPSQDAPGVPNWEIEELKSITDGHTLLRPPADSKSSWGWSVDLYRSLPRLGTDAMHPALISVKAHSLRLRMLQGNDRALYMRDTLGDGKMLDAEEPLELSFAELLLEQPSGKPFTVEEEAAHLLITDNPRCRALSESCDRATLQQLVERLLDSDAGKRLALDTRLDGVVSQEGVQLVRDEVSTW